MTVETLSSNVVNYLVWRYLQEAGYAAAAVQLSKHWTRDPQALPFAHNVRPRALVNILQDGLVYDQLLSSVSKVAPRYTFGTDHGRPYSMHHNAAVGLDVDIDASMPSCPVDSNSLLAEMNSRKASTKRRKRILAAEHRTNGDFMDVDADLPSQSRGESEAVMSDPESPIIEDISQSSSATLTIGQSVEIQTDKIMDLASQTVHLNVNDKPNAMVTKTIWHKTNPNLLFAMGDSLMRMWHLTSSQLSLASSKGWSLDIEMPVRTPFVATAFEWACDEEALVATVDEHPTEDDMTVSMGTLIGMNGSNFRIISSLVGTVVAIRWREPTKTFLTASTTDKEGRIMVWKYTESIPIASLHTKHPVYDVVWMSDHIFALCGQRLLNIYEYSEDQVLTLIKSYETSSDWAKLLWDDLKSILVTTSLDTNEIGIISWNFAEHIGELHRKMFKDDRVTDMKFQPNSRHDSMTLDQAPRLLATSHEKGSIIIWDANRPFECIRELFLDGGPALSLAFSPDGFLLAAAGDDTILIWNSENGSRPKATWKGTLSSAIRHPLVERLYSMQIEERDTNLQWDVDGKKLAYTVGNEIAVINFQG